MRGQVKFNVVHRHIGVKRRLEGTFMSQNRISFSSVLKAKGGRTICQPTSQAIRASHGKK